MSPSASNLGPHRCPACGYELTGLPGAPLCPECGRALDWDLIHGRRVPRRKDREAWALLVAPHIAAVLLTLGLFIGTQVFPMRDAPPGLLLVCIIAYLTVGPLCAISGVHTLRRGERSAAGLYWSAVLGLLVFVAYAIIAGVVIGIVAPLLEPPRY